MNGDGDPTDVLLLITALEGGAAAVAVVVGVVTFIITSRRERVLRRAELVRQYTVDFHESRGVSQMYEDIEHRRLRFDAESWLGKEPEMTAVRMLDLFNSLGHNWRHGVLELDDIHGTTLGRAALITSRSSAIREYLATLPVHGEGASSTGTHFDYFRRLAAALEQRARPGAPAPP
ncbi:hypothetical protein ACFQ58_10865 [Agromyces sp. NPDC056523]|uniref:hypothetical protein n=1 Tax=Agromyces sp. NPDC056523 TaxID=3345850 RepID=UPI00366D4641